MQGHLDCIHNPDLDHNLTTLNLACRTVVATGRAFVAACHVMCILQHAQTYTSKYNHLLTTKLPQDWGEGTPTHHVLVVPEAVDHSIEVLELAADIEALVLRRPDSSVGAA